MNKKKGSFLLLLLLYACFCAAQNYLAIGDSYTIGEAVEATQRWPNQLTNLLNKNKKQINPPLIIAQTGWRTDEALKAVENYKHSSTYDLISVLIGVNNQYQKKELKQFEEDLRKILEKAILLSSNGPKGVFALSIPDYGVTPFAENKHPEQIALEIDQYNQVYKNICKEYNILFLDITEISRLAKSKPYLIAEDGLHPSGEMYKLWVESIATSVEKLLEY